MEVKLKRIEYTCRYCGKKDLKTNRSGRPMPGKCPRRGANQPHSWVKNREW